MSCSLVYHGTEQNEVILLWSLDKAENEYKYLDSN